MINLFRKVIFNGHVISTWADPLQSSSHVSLFSRKVLHDRVHLLIVMKIFLDPNNESCSNFKIDYMFDFLYIKAIE